MGARPDEELDEINQKGQHCPAPQAPVPVVLALKPGNLDGHAAGDQIHECSSEVRPLKKPRPEEHDGVNPGNVPIPAQYQPVNHQSPRIH